MTKKRATVCTYIFLFALWLDISHQVTPWMLIRKEATTFKKPFGSLQMTISPVFHFYFYHFSSFCCVVCLLFFFEKVQERTISRPQNTLKRIVLLLKKKANSKPLILFWILNLLYFLIIIEKLETTYSLNYQSLESVSLCNLC